MTSNPSNIFIYGLGATAIAGVVMFFLRKFSGSSIEQTTKQLLDQSIDEKQQNIKQLNQQQELILNQLKESEKVSEESKQKINTIINNASQQVTQILQDESIDNIDKKIQNDWKDL